MLRRLAAVAACVVFLAAVPTGSLYVTTLPAGADVWVDGTYVGRSPVFADALPAGRHTIGLARSGWTAQQVDVTVVPSQTALSSVRLDPAKTGPAAGPGSIVILGIATLGITLDGLPAKPGKDGSIGAAAGVHDLTVETAHGKLSRTITVWPQTRTDVVLQPETSPARPVVVAPADDYLPADAVRIDGDRIVIHAPGHEAIGKMGSTTYRLDGRLVEYPSAPTLIGRRIYLPIELLTALTPQRDH
jgi:hypothetical protein